MADLLAMTKIPKLKMIARGYYAHKGIWISKDGELPCQEVGNHLAGIESYEYFP